jgi:hypothetical protein
MTYSESPYGLRILKAVRTHLPKFLPEAHLEHDLIAFEDYEKVGLCQISKKTYFT